MTFDFERYSRQIEILGTKRQEKLFNSSALVVGAGGLGSAVIQYLASAGIGRLGIIDGDIVEKSNLQRQTIHAGNLGMNKAESACAFVEKLNPEVVVDVYPYNITPRNSEKILNAYDVIVGCPDNFRIRFLINDTCNLLKKPFVHSAVYSFFGELSTFLGRPCYRCYLPKATVPSVGGVIGATVGIFGCMQALEVIKLLTGYGELTTKKIIIFDLSTMKLFEIALTERKDCPVCNGKLKGIYEENYEGDCQIVKLE
ncbi:MAG: HesA/MoeB/ThiF family protein [Archaeoglobaceae archaeon]|nr:HesA/MoeB/ThiF family protein [Archaeoglobaceae archaeon]MDW7989747.1 HesA/MoeB/ThiF family protein [Archaeoglobaceae archaeon]